MSNGDFPRTQAEALLALMHFCDDVATDGDHFYSCVEEPGHRGPHRKGRLTWTDELPFPRIQDAPRSGT